ncbi:hypothetical protein GCM10009558_106020 [Virgisporangium aurantiacum]
MTEHRDLKRLVRERMARTGESYSTARRHVTARQPQRSAHRESALVARLLSDAGQLAPHTGEPFTEAMVCGLAGGIGFLYAVFEYKGLPPLVTLVAQHHPAPWAPAALRRAGVASTEAHSGSPAPATTALRRDLDAGGTVLCTIARGRLPWHPDDPFDADPYPVLVTAGTGDDIMVDDGTGTPRTLPLETFVTAWSAHRKGRHHRLVVTGERTGDPAVRDAIATTVAHLTGPVLGNAFDVNFGLSGLERFASQLRDERTKTGWARRFADPDALAAGLRRVHDCVERELTAPGATRPLYAEFLDEAATIVDLPPAPADAYREAGARWHRLASAALTASHMRETALSRLADLADDVLAAERTAAGVIAEV